MVKKVFIVVEDTYAPHALKRVLRKRSPNLAGIEVVHLNVCSKKMERIVKAHIKQGSRVVIIADAEHMQAKLREEQIRKRHGLSSNVKIIIADPCMEALACEALGLRRCREKPCGEGPLSEVKVYWRRKHGRDYDKRFLPDLFSEADGSSNRLDRVPEFRELTKALEDP